MKTMHVLSMVAPAIFFALSAIPCPATETRQTENFDSNWLFLKADATGAEQNQFDDSTWRKLDVPHDWSIEGPFAETNQAGGAGAFLPSGVAWYRKHFTMPKDFDTGRCAFIEFDGVMANSDVWINGFHLGHRPYGYVSFSYELTGHLNSSGDNVIAVRADTSQQPASRWYAGAGIYRHVRLVTTDPVHIGSWGVFVTTPEVNQDRATVGINARMVNSSGEEATVTASTEIYRLNAQGEKAGKPVAWQGHKQSSIRIAAGSTSPNSSAVVQVPNPKLWSVETPNLYQAVTTVRCEGRGSVDIVETTFGIREARFTSDQGFMLNGRKVVLHGVCLHADGGAFGAAVPLAIWEQRLTELRRLGVNAVRTAHNPPAPEFLDLCDRMGFLVMDELFDCWTVAKNPYDYHLFFNDWSKTDAADTVRRDRNHPSVILYSAGNEIHDTPNAALANRILTGLVEVFHANDPSRPVTQALFRPNVSGDYTNGLADLLDVVGTNYRDNELLAAQRAKPDRKIVGTEQRHDRQTWLWLRENPSHAGQFLWSGVDYLGESRRWPVVAAGSGLLDHTGAPKPMAFERQSWWLNKPMVFITRRTAATQTAPADPGFAPLDRRQVLFADWSPADLQAPAENVEVYSNCKEVELFLNGKSLGAKTINADASPRNWQVPFASGKLKAVARNNGKAVATAELRTAGRPEKIVLSANARKLSPGWDNVAWVRAKIVDANGIEIPRADDSISFKISGPGAILAVDSADNSSHEPFQATTRHAFEGKCVAFVKATGTPGRIVLTATAPGLTAGSIIINATRHRP